MDAFFAFERCIFTLQPDNYKIDAIATICCTSVTYTIVANICSVVFNKSLTYNSLKYKYGLITNFIE